MAKKIIWTDYINEEALFRYWYILENNNFKNTLKKVTQNKEMGITAAVMHNALYSGLYYNNQPLDISRKTTFEIRDEKNLPRRATLANFMSREEVLMNIHAMFEAANAVRTHSDFGYTNKLFARKFWEIGKLEKERHTKLKIKPHLLYGSKPNADEQSPNKPNRYNLARNFMKHQLKNGFNPRFTSVSSKESKKMFSKALTKYKIAKFNFENALKTLGIFDPEKRAYLMAQADVGFYRTILPVYGFSIDTLLQEDDAKSLISAKELKAHANKLNKSLDKILGKDNATFKQLEQLIRSGGEEARQVYIRTHKKYPEVERGFKNAFCEMISHKIVASQELLSEKGAKMDVNDFASRIIQTIVALQKEHDLATNEQEKKDIEEKLESFRKSLNDESNKGEEKA